MHEYPGVWGVMYTTPVTSYLGLLHAGRPISPTLALGSEAQPNYCQPLNPSHLVYGWLPVQTPARSPSYFRTCAMKSLTNIKTPLAEPLAVLRRSLLPTSKDRPLLTQVRQTQCVTSMVHSTR